VTQTVYTQPASMTTTRTFCVSCAQCNAEIDVDASSFTAAKNKAVRDYGWTRRDDVTGQWVVCSDCSKPTAAMTTPRKEETPLQATNFFAAAPVTQKPEALIHNRQYSALREAITNGPAALLEFAKKEQKKRTDWAGKHWKTYRLSKPAGSRYAAGRV